MLELRNSGNDIVAPYAEEFPGSTFYPGKKPWEQKVDIALPCATQNELDADDARNVQLKLSTCSSSINNFLHRARLSTPAVSPLPAWK